MRARLLLIWLCALGGAGCALLETAQHAPDPQEYLQAISASLNQGEVERAEEILARARNRFHDDGGILQLSALLAQMRGRDEEAIGDLRRLELASGHGGLSAGELSERIGDLLFRAGRWAESAAPLARASGGEHVELRRALAQLTARLPYARMPPRSLAVEMPLLDDPMPHLLCTLSGKQRVLVLDTGASFTTLARSLADELGAGPFVPAGDALDGTGRPFPVTVGVLKEFVLGDSDLGAQPVVVVEDGRLDLRDISGGAEGRASGVVGQDMLLRFRVTLDPKRRSVIFELPRGLPETESVACVRHEGRLLAPARVENRTLWLIVDTGASHSSLTDEGLMTLPGGARRAVDGYAKLRGPGGTTVAVRVVHDLTLAVSGMRFSGCSMPILARGKRGAFPVHGVLGADLLARARLTLDQDRLRLSAASR